MASLNKVMLIGNVVRDPELRYIPNGTAVADFPMAVNREWTDRDGEKYSSREGCNWIPGRRRRAKSDRSIV